MTNFERIKNMTAEEMMEFIIYERSCDCDCCIYVYNDNCTMPKCKEGIKAWLEQEADND